MALEALESRLVLAVSTWSGAVDALWSNNGNWDTPPVAGNDLVFPAASFNLTNTNDLAAGTSFAGVAVGGGGYSIAGNAIDLTEPVAANFATGTSTLALPVSFTGAGVVNVSIGGSSLAVTGPVGGSAGLSKLGPGNLTLSGPNTYTGTTGVGGGRLVVDGNQPGSPITLAANTTLAGTGTVGSITATAAGVQPGDSAPGILTDAGDLTLDPVSSVGFVANGTAPGVGYSQLVVDGNVALNNATLSLAVGYSPVGGQQLTLIDNAGTNPVTGTFAGLAEGGVVASNGHSFKVSYVGGTGNDVVVTALGTTTTNLVINPAPSVFGQAVTITATVNGGATPGTPTGGVQFLNGTTVIGTGTLNGSGVATLTTAALPVGTNPISVKYLGDTNFAADTSPVSNITTNKASTSDVLQVTPSPSLAGQAVTLTATVSPSPPGAGVPTGTVSFLNGNVILGTAPVNASGVATFTTSSLPIGAVTLNATYGGDTNFNTSTTAFSTVVSAANTATTLAASTTTPVVGQSVTYTATVAPTVSGLGVPTGTVTFLNGTTSLGTATLDATGKATLTTAALPLGPNSVTASYGGTTTFNNSVSSPLVTTVGQSNTSLALTVSKTDVVAYEAVTLTATAAAVSPATGTPTGTVDFRVNGVSVGTGTLTNGVATLVTTELPLGTDSVTAVYQGDTKFTTVTSNPVAVTAGTTVETFINQVYLDVLGRPAESEALDYWRTRIETGTPVKAVIREITSSGEAHSAAVQYGYQRFLGRPASATEESQALAAPNSGYASFYANLFGSREYYQLVGGTPSDFVSAAYKDIVGETIPAATETALTAALRNGESRQSIALGLINSRAGRAAIVGTLFTTILGRDPSASELRRSVSQLGDGVGLRGLTYELLSSKQFLAHYPGI